MSTLFGFVKPKGYTVTCYTTNRKRCYPANVMIYKKKQKLPNFDTLRITQKNTVPTMVENSNSHKQKETKKKAKTGSGISFVKNEKHRLNPFNIQMLSESLHRQIFKSNGSLRPQNPELINRAKQKLEEYGLWRNDIKYLKDVSLNLPPLKGRNIEEHFYIIGEEQCKPYRKLVSSFIKTGLPNRPEKWLCQKGWTKYVEGKEPVVVPFPDDDVLVFDVEVIVKLGNLPTLATAVSSNAWYGWVCSDLAEGVDSIPSNWYRTNMLIPMEGKAANRERPRIIIGHNVSYDRARMREQYYLKNSALRFLDTMSLHICIGGMTKSQKVLLKNKSLEVENDLGKEQCFCSLKELYDLYCYKQLEKEPKSVFLEGLMPDVKKDFQSLMKYCSNDVKATYEVLQAVFPTFLSRFSHPVTLAGMLEMGSAFLPVNQNWNKFLSEADQTYEDLKNELSSILSKKCDNACNLLHNEQYKKNLWMWSEDWTTQKLKFNKGKIKQKVFEGEKSIAEKCLEEKEQEEEINKEEELKLKFQSIFDLGKLLPKKLPFLPGYPLWYRKLCKKPDSSDWTSGPQLSTSMYVTPKLLNLTWENFPLHHHQDFGWGILVPDIFAENIKTSIPFENLKKLTLKNCNIDLNGLEKNLKLKMKQHKNSVPYYQGSGIWCNHMIDECCFFFKIPHKDGGSKNVGNPLSKDIAHLFYSGVLSSQDPEALKVLNLDHQLTYWRNNKQRITGQMVVWLNKKEACTVNGCDEDSIIGVILPQVVVCGTLTRRAMESTWLTASKATQNRIGSELRSMIQAPPGYHFVGADVDSQELWIASLIGDSNFAKEHGSTPFGWMTISGTKSYGTDMHSITAKAVGISRTQAKTINYARIYGAGVKFAHKLLKQSNPSLSSEEAWSKATKMYSLTKGQKEFKVKNCFRNKIGLKVKIYDLGSAVRLAEKLGKKVDEVFDKPQWTNGTESAMFNQLEKIAKSANPVTPFLHGRLSRALEPRFEDDDFYLNTRINWVVQSGAVDFLHLMLVCMQWLTNGKAKYCFSFHDEVRYLLPTEQRYNGALALHITNLLVRSFCSHRLGMYDLPLSVAFFSSVEVDKTLRKEAGDDCVTPSNPHGMEKGYGILPGESLNIYETLEKSGGSISIFGTGKKKGMSQATKRRHVQREILQEELVHPKENQKIVRVLGSRGSNLHEVETPESIMYLVSMPSKFRKNVWIKRGDYILVEPIVDGGKVKAEIVKVLTSHYIKFLKKENIWPKEFMQNSTEGIAESTNNDFFENNNRRIGNENVSIDNEE